MHALCFYYYSPDDNRKMGGNKQTSNVECLEEYFVVRVYLILFLCLLTLLHLSFPTVPIYYGKGIMLRQARATQARDSNVLHRQCFAFLVK